MGGMNMTMQPMRPPVYLLHDNTLYLLVGSQLLAIDTQTGDVASKTSIAGSDAVKTKQ
jgi:hypothetical protein